MWYAAKFKIFDAKKKQEKLSEVIEIKRLGQTVRRKQLCVKHEKLKWNKRKKKTIENQFIFRDQKEEQFRQDNIRTK